MGFFTLSKEIKCNSETARGTGRFEKPSFKEKKCTLGCSRTYLPSRCHRWRSFSCVDSQPLVWERETSYWSYFRPGDVNNLLSIAGLRCFCGRHSYLAERQKPKYPYPPVGWKSFVCWSCGCLKAIKALQQPSRKAKGSRVARPISYFGPCWVEMTCNQRNIIN